MLAIKIKQGDNKVDNNEWRYLLSGPSGEIAIPNNPTSWIPDNQWPDLYRQFYGTGQLPNFLNIHEHFLAHPDKWKHIFDSASPQEESLP